MRAVIKKKKKKIHLAFGYGTCNLTTSKYYFGIMIELIELSMAIKE